MCMQIIEKYAVCGCVYYTHGVDFCPRRDQRGHLVTIREIYVGYACSRHPVLSSSGAISSGLSYSTANLGDPDPEPVIQDRRAKPRCFDHGCNGREFSTFSNLLRHQREKAGVGAKSYCPNCGAAFSRITTLKKHMSSGQCQPRQSADVEVSGEKDPRSASSKIPIPPIADHGDSSNSSPSNSWIHLCIESYAGRIRLKAVDVSNICTDETMFTKINEAYFGKGFWQRMRRTCSLSTVTQIKFVHVGSLPNYISTSQGLMISVQHESTWSCFYRERRSSEHATTHAVFVFTVPINSGRPYPE